MYWNVKQGEGAALPRKGICANHVKDVGAFFRGAHVTIHARNEEEVEPSVILDKVAKASSTKLDFKDRSDIVENTGPVGTNYQRVQAAKEINSSERESFWTRQQEDERKRKIEERKRIEEEKRKVEDQEKKRELLEAKDREVSSVKKDQEIAKRREMEKNAENRARDLLDVRRLSNADDEFEDPEEERTRRSEEARKQRALEARNLIDKSKIKDVRAMFEQHSSAPVVPVKKPGLVAKAINRFNGTTNVVKKPVESSSFAAIKDAFEPTKKAEPITQVNHVQNTKKLFEQQSSQASQVVKTTVKPTATPTATNGKTNGTVNASAAPQSVTPSMKPDVIPIADHVVQSPSPAAATASTQETNSEPDDEEPIASPVEEDSDSDYIVHEEVEQPPRRLSSYDLPVGEHMLEDIAEEPEEDEHADHGSNNKIGQHKSSEGIKARALYDYQAADETEISFDPEDIITHIDMIDPGWYQGMAPDGTFGLFPANYVEILDD